MDNYMVTIITWQALGLLCVVPERNLYVSYLELFLCGDAREGSGKYKLRSQVLIFEEVLLMYKSSLL